MDHNSRTELLAIAKKRGFLRYSSLNKHQLIGLLTRGYHEVPKVHHYECIHSAKGLPPAEFILSPKLNDIVGPTKFRYTIDTKMYNGTSRIVRGIDLTGMFDAKYIPATVHDEDDEWPTYIEGGWVISNHEYPNFLTFYETLLASTNQPKSLFETAAWAVNSRKQEHYIPKLLRMQIKQVTSN
jgi:hypothetical protein